MELPNRKQLGVVGTSDVIDLANAVAAVFTVGIRRGRVWKVYWVNLYLFPVDEMIEKFVTLTYFIFFQLYLETVTSEFKPVPVSGT